MKFDVIVGLVDTVPVYIAREGDTVRTQIGTVRVTATEFQIVDPDHSLYGTVYGSMELAAEALAQAYASGVPGRDPSYFQFGPVRFDGEWLD